MVESTNQTVTEFALEVFGSEEKAKIWLNQENLGLGGVTPDSLLNTKEGEASVKKILAAITYGGVV